MSRLFTPIQLGGITLPNRIVIAPMCQYSAADGAMTDWHMIHLGSLAVSGAGLSMVEATGVTREGRISHFCTGLYTDENEAAMQRAVLAYRRITKSPIGVQIAHAGRKASTQPPWGGGKPLSADQSPWQTVAPSALAFGESWHVPHALSVAEIRKLVDDFVASTERARRIGFDVAEIHASHGYLLHQFLSPVSNTRTDQYGGSLENRMRFPLEVARALREVWPKERCLGARITGSDWLDEGAKIEDCIAFARELKALNYDYVCVTSGGLSPTARMQIGPNYQVPFAAAVKKAVPIAVRAVGLIADPDEAEAILARGEADMVALARAILDNPRWVWHAAERFGVKIDYPPQYSRAQPDVWPGAKLARPSIETQAAE